MFKLMRRKEVESLIGLKRSAIYKKMSEGGFPKPIKIGSRTVCWVESEIFAWIGDQVTGRKESDVD